MKQEIERKFLVINNIYKNGSVSTFYKQGYLCTDASRTVRIRIAGEKGFITIKGITTGCSRTEYEYEIPTADAMTLLDMLCIKPLIEKYVTATRLPTGKYGKSTNSKAKTKALSSPK